MSKMVEQIKEVEKVESFKLLFKYIITVVLSLLLNVGVFMAFYCYWYFKTDLDSLYLLGWWLVFGLLIHGFLISITYDILKYMYRTSKIKVRTKAKSIRKDFMTRNVKELGLEE
jgi:sterol desaturase/sphingolipid hydroxylase (fatty acid hydroxylase superfamily)